MMALNAVSNNLGMALQIMGQGMLGIFVVIIIIALAVYIMTKVNKNKE